MNQRTYVGLDVHARNVVGCAIDERTGEIKRQRLAANNAGIVDWVNRTGFDGEIDYPEGWILCQQDRSIRRS